MTDVFSKQTLKIYFKFGGFIEWLKLSATYMVYSK